MPYEEVVDRPDSRSDVKDNFKKNDQYQTNNYNDFVNNLIRIECYEKQ
ncbi:hypothetical protein Murru_2686 [Allomuricauda ruestringensis DSM 13258]|uniref:Uncharacterized protein n=1 Tax=Allomuricauda ruestringensis (strain DSM 13258 / CIP 107369 / LMG 19739 / B1) TaxID=886377 RepID=G2PIA1_ALLRU|nr:hypothetical protein Murru_2686 [Allomuricauda ruestringensis DSM 13258]